MNFKTSFISLIFVLLSTTFCQATPKQRPITMTIPDTVIKEAITKSLPLDFKIQSDTLIGSVSIDQITRLQLKDKNLSGHILLTGHKLNIVTNIAGHDLRMKIGSLTMGFQCDATIRFDAASQTLYLKPVISNIQSSDSNKTDIASAIVLLLNDREYPLQIEKLKPIIADTGNKFLSLSMHIADIQLQPNSLSVSITPDIQASFK